MINLPTFYFSYFQFLVNDREVKDFELTHSDITFGLGFTRKESLVSSRTFESFGHAPLRYSLSAYVPNESYEGVIAVPFRVTSGRVNISSPEDYPAPISLEMPPGDYRLTCAQRATGFESERIDLFFERLETPMEKSEVLVADDELESQARARLRELTR